MPSFHWAGRGRRGETLAKRYLCGYLRARVRLILIDIYSLATQVGTYYLGRYLWVTINCPLGKTHNYPVVPCSPGKLRWTTGNKKWQWSTEVHLGVNGRMTILLNKVTAQMIMTYHLLQCDLICVASNHGLFQLSNNPYSENLCYKPMLLSYTYMITLTTRSSTISAFDFQFPNES